MCVYFIYNIVKFWILNVYGWIFGGLLDCCLLATVVLFIVDLGLLAFCDVLVVCFGLGLVRCCFLLFGCLLIVLWFGGWWLVCVVCLNYLVFWCFGVYLLAVACCVVLLVFAAVLMFAGFKLGLTVWIGYGFDWFSLVWVVVYLRCDLGLMLDSVVVSL